VEGFHAGAHNMFDRIILHQNSLHSDKGHLSQVPGSLGNLILQGSHCDHQTRVTNQGIHFAGGSIQPVVHPTPEEVSEAI
jgi:hypothetical protein